MEQLPNGTFPHRIFLPHRLLEGLPRPIRNEIVFRILSRGDLMFFPPNAQYAGPTDALFEDAVEEILRHEDPVRFFFVV